MPEVAAAPAADPTATSASPDPAPAAAKAGVSPSPAKDPAPAGPDPVAETEVKPYWPEDWKERIAKGDEKISKRLARLGSPEQVTRSLLELERKHQSGMYKATLPEDADDATKAEYRKSWGIPDKPEGYGIEFPKVPGYEPSDADKADLTEFLGRMHAVHAPPAVVKGAVDSFWEMMVKSQGQMREVAQEKQINWQAEIRSEWGKDYKRNTQLVSASLDAAFGGDHEKAEEFKDTLLFGGLRLGDHPDFLRVFHHMALKTADDSALAMPDISASGGGNLDTVYAAALEMQWTNPKEYYSQSHQQKLERLAAAKAEREAKTARPQAA
jgi:hypothetical protein